MKIAIVDHSTSPVDPGSLASIARAIYCQLVEVAQKWSLGFWTPVAPPDAVTVKAPSETLGQDEFEIGIFDTSDAPGAAGYHATDPRGMPYGKVFRDAVDSILQGSFPLSVVVSHEACELFIDAPACLYAARADGTTLDALEACDAVEDVTYLDPEGNGCLLSDYLLPAAFDGGAPGPYDRQGALAGQYDTTAGGYRIKMVAQVAQSGTAGFIVVAHYGPQSVFARTDRIALARQRAKGHQASRMRARRVMYARRAGVDGPAVWQATASKGPSPKLPHDHAPLCPDCGEPMTDMRGSTIGRFMGMMAGAGLGAVIGSVFGSDFEGSVAHLSAATKDMFRDYPELIDHLQTALRNLRPQQGQRPRPTGPRPDHLRPVPDPPPSKL